MIGLIVELGTSTSFSVLPISLIRRSVSTGLDPTFPLSLDSRLKTWAVECNHHRLCLECPLDIPTPIDSWIDMQCGTGGQNSLCEPPPWCSVAIVFSLLNCCCADGEVTRDYIMPLIIVLLQESACAIIPLVWSALIHPSWPCPRPLTPLPLCWC